MSDRTVDTVIYHLHHIVPRHAGGSDHPSNIERLTVEAHAEAHRKLYEQYGRWQDYLAWMGLSGRIGKEEAIRIVLSNTHKGKILSGEHLEKLRRANTGRKREFSDAHKQKLRERHTDARGSKNAFFGRKHSAETRARLSEIAKQRKRERDANGRYT